MNNKYVNGVFSCLIATLSWGAMFPIMTDALEKIDPFNFTALRYLIAGLAFLAILIRVEGVDALKLKGERWILAWFFGTCGFAGFGFLVFWGQQLAGSTGALTASITMATMPMLGMLVVWVVRGARPKLPTFCFIIASFCGVALVISKGDFSSLFTNGQNYLANLPIIAGALCWVIYTVGATFFPTWSPYRYTTITTLLGMSSILFVNYILIMSGVIGVPSLSAVISVTPHLLYMSLIAGMVAVLAWNIGNKLITPMNGVLFMDVVPITAFTLSAMSGVVPEPAQVAGASITAAALVINNFYQRYVAASSAPASKVQASSSNVMAK